MCILYKYSKHPTPPLIHQFSVNSAVLLLSRRKRKRRMGERRGTAEFIESSHPPLPLSP